MNKNYLNGLIIEGISGTGKTTILKSILKNERYNSRKVLSTIVYTEHQTQRILEKKEKEKSLTLDDSILLLTDITTHLKKLNNRLIERNWEGISSEESGISYILERFHFTHVCHYPHMNWRDVKPIDLDLSCLGGKLCILTVSEDILSKRLFDRNNTCWINYLKKFGNTKEEIISYFINQQNQYIKLCKISNLPYIIIDTSNKSKESIVDTVFDYWKLL